MHLNGFSLSIQDGIICAYFFYISRHTLPRRGDHWDNGPSQYQGEGEQEEGAGERWPNWTHWL